MKNEKRTYSDYFIGIDAGTDSVGWAVTDEQYNILKFGKKAMWGIRLFDEANPAADRRMYRTQRRRYGRRAQRTKLLQELFAEEIAKKDPGFFLRMKESKYLPEDRKFDFKYLLFNDDNYTDGDFHKEYPTVYHLRKAFLDGKNISDPRLLYLAVHHIIINRGHFLFDGVNVENVTKFETVFNSLVEYINDNFDSESDIKKITDVDTAEFSEILKSKSTVTAKKKALYELFGVKKGQLKAVCDLLAGSSSVKLSDLFDNETLNSAEKNKITFSSSSYQDEHDSYEEILDGDIIFTDLLKSVYDWSILADILGDNSYISQSKVKSYDKHRADLELLKKVVNKHCRDKYYDLFKSDKNDKNYCAYSGMCKIGGKKKEIKRVKQDDFYAEIKKILKPFDDDDDVKIIFSDIETKSFLPKQISTENCALPYQLNEFELKRILSNAGNNFPFLKEKDESGITVSDKIMKLLTFRIPYYVGPLNDAHKSENSNCWMVRRDNSKDRITPWNFENKVDIEQSAQEFIFRMTNKCTYLYGEDVLPKNSLLYSEYEVLNELNNLSLNGERLNVEDKKDIIEKVFKQKNKVKIKDIVNYYRSVGKEVSADDFSGLADMKEFKSSLKSYRDFDKILGGRFNYNYAEEAILAVLLFSGDKKILTSRLKKIGGGYFTDDEIKKISSLRYSDWGRFSKKLLTGVYSAYSQTGEYMNIITAMRETTCNFMETQGQNFGFKDEIRKINSEVMPKINEFSYDALVKDLYVSPKIKRSVWQTLLIVREIVKITGHEPKKIFIEMARGTDGTSKTPDSRKKKLHDFYKNCQKEKFEIIKSIDFEGLNQSLEARDDSELRSDKLYFYYSQLGRDMYTGEEISLDNFSNYDKDHIYPRSLTKDDSLDNLVLVKKTINQDEKKAVYPIPNGIIKPKARELWEVLLKNGLISKEKYYRLTRTTEFSLEERASFVNRQVIETQQSAKAIVNVLKQVFPKSAVIGVKAGIVKDFKDKYKIEKVRMVNDNHHAKDAYVSIISGNVFDTKFKHNAWAYFKNNDFEKYTLNASIYDSNVGSKEKPAWKGGANGSIKTVKKMIADEQSILYTRYAFIRDGSFFDENLLSKTNLSARVPSKTGDAHFIGQSDNEIIAKYGGYKANYAYYCLVEHLDKKKRIRTIESVPAYLSNLIEKDPAVLDNYLKNNLELKDPKIILRKIKIDTLFCIDGFRAYLSGRKNDSKLRFKIGVQLLLPDDMYDYSKKIEIFMKHYPKITESKLNDAVISYYKFDSAKNMELYDFFLIKMNSKPYNYLLGKKYYKFVDKRPDFIKLSVFEQITVLFRLFKVFKCTAEFADFNDKDFYVGTEIGLMLENKKISKKSYYIINQSPTGLFENKINLKTI